MIEPIPKGSKVRKEPPQCAYENITEDPKVRKETPQIHHSTSQKMYVDGAKSSLSPRG